MDLISEIKYYWPLIPSLIFFGRVKDDFKRSTYHAYGSIIASLGTLVLRQNDYVGIMISGGYFIFDLTTLHKHSPYYYYITHHLTMLLVLFKIMRNKYLTNNNVYSFMVLCELTNPIQNMYALNKSKKKWYLTLLSLVSVRLLLVNWLIYTQLKKKEVWDNFKNYELAATSLFVVGNIYITYKHLKHYKYLKHLPRKST
jgi:hypothetical protein